MENLGQLLPFAVNFSIVIIILALALRKPLQRFVYQRHERWKDFLEDSAKTHALAKERFLRAEREIRSVDEEARKLINKEVSSAREEASELLRKAEEELRRVRNEADRLVEAQGADISERIKAEFVDLIVGQAELQLKQGLKRDDHRAIIKRAQASIEVGI